MWLGSVQTGAECCSCDMTVSHNDERRLDSAAARDRCPTGDSDEARVKTRGSMRYRRCAISWRSQRLVLLQSESTLWEGGSRRRQRGLQDDPKAARARISDQTSTLDAAA